MGSFNVSCSLSGKSISPGDSAVLIPMIRNSVLQQNLNISLEPCSQVISNSDSKILVPVSIPIFGYYNDYGSIKVVDDLNPCKEITEAYYKTTLERLANFVTGYGEAYNLLDYFPNGAYGIWIDGVVWDEMIKSYNSIETINYSMWPTPWVLLNTGFNISGKSNDSRYSDVWIHPEVKGELWSDGFFIKDPENVFGLYKIKDLINWCKDRNYTLDVSSLGSERHIAEIKSLVFEAATSKAAKYAAKRKTLLPELIRELESEIDPILIDRDKEYLLSLKEEMKNPFMRRHHNWKWIFGGTNIKHMELAYALGLESENELLIRSIAELYAIKRIFISCGRLMLPTESGPQCGEPYYTKALGKALIKTSQKTIDELKKWEDDELKKWEE